MSLKDTYVLEIYYLSSYFKQQLQQIEELLLM